MTEKQTTVTFPVLQGNDLKLANRRKQQRRQSRLEAFARVAGWNNWSEFCTAVHNSEATIPQKKGDS